jgi:hypothetical protein
MPAKADKRASALERVKAEQRSIRSGFVIGYGSEAVESLLNLVEDALEEAATEIARLKGQLAARDGREIILTFDRIGTEGVPVHFEDGTRLKCTDSDREWVLSDGQWVLVTQGETGR